jgi:hypothetical protein
MNRSTGTALVLAPLLLTSALAPTTGDWTQAELEAVTAEIQKEVEEIRGAKFKHPVDVKIIDKAGFIKYAMMRTEEMTTPAELQAEEEIGKMLGLIPADMDLMQATLDLLEGQVGGFYDPAGNIFFLMEGFTGDIARVILAHELTHALDDQFHDLDGGFEARMQNGDSLSAYQSVVEGSGTAAMNSWTMAHMADLDLAGLAGQDSMGMEAMAESPVSLWKPMLASYMAGNQFLTKGQSILRKAARKIDRKAARDIKLHTAIERAFEKPPLSMEQVLHPEKYWDESKRDDPKAVEVSIAAPEGWEVHKRTVLGEMQIALLTDDAEPIDLTNPMELMTMKYTNDAAAGWGGDQLALYAKGEARWLVVSIVWDTKEDADEFMAAMNTNPRLPNWRTQVAQLDKAKKGSGVSINREAENRVTFDVWVGFDRSMHSLAK